MARDLELRTKTIGKVNNLISKAMDRMQYTTNGGEIDWEQKPTEEEKEIIAAYLKTKGRPVKYEERPTKDQTQYIFIVGS